MSQCRCLLLVNGPQRMVSALKRRRDSFKRGCLYSRTGNTCHADIWTLQFHSFVHSFLPSFILSFIHSINTERPLRGRHGAKGWRLKEQPDSGENWVMELIKCSYLCIKINRNINSNTSFHDFSKELISTSLALHF